jgi:hypothetical protein
MYAKIENNEVVEYPLYEGDLERRFPELKFPMDTYGTTIPDGYVRVGPPDFITTKEFHHYVEITPVLVDGVWKQNFSEIPYTEDEIQNALPYIINLVIKKRNELLKSSDWTQLADSPISDDRKEQFKKYRQELRDLPLQENFPINVNFPVEPF